MFILLIIFSVLVITFKTWTSKLQCPLLETSFSDIFHPISDICPQKFGSNFLQQISMFFSSDNYLKNRYELHFLYLSYTEKQIHLLQIQSV